jgi:hypothetical protein
MLENQGWTGALKEELFERERGTDPDDGWDVCTLVCEQMEENLC